MKKLGFGLMRLPRNNPTDYKDIDLGEMQRMVDRFMEKGFTYYDTAYVYHGGESETAFRETVVKKYPRDSFTITDKLPMFIIQSEEQLEPIFAETLERLGVDYLDYYWLHSLNKSNYELAEKVHAFEFIQQKQAEGKIKNIGFSFHDKADVLEAILKNHPEMDFVQLQLNYLDWEDESIQSRKCYELCEKYNKQVIVMEPLKGGSLVNVPAEVENMFKAYAPDASIPSWGIRFAASHKNVMVVLSGMGTEAQMIDNLSYMDHFEPLNQEEMELVKKAAEIIRSSIAIPCTSCHYCDGCPKDIAIPEYFSAYNNLKRFGREQLMVSRTYYNGLAEYRGKASECVACGRCEEHCPQHIEIINGLKLVVEEIENT